MEVRITAVSDNGIEALNKLYLTRLDDDDRTLLKKAHAREYRRIVSMKPLTAIFGISGIPLIPESFRDRYENYIHSELERNGSFDGDCIVEVSL